MLEYQNVITADVDSELSPTGTYWGRTTRRSNPLKVGDLLHFTRTGKKSLVIYVGPTTETPTQEYKDPHGRYTHGTTPIIHFMQSMAPPTLQLQVPKLQSNFTDWKTGKLKNNPTKGDFKIMNNFTDGAIVKTIFNGKLGRVSGNNVQMYSKATNTMHAVPLSAIYGVKVDAVEFAIPEQVALKDINAGDFMQGTAEIAIVTSSNPQTGAVTYFTLLDPTTPRTMVVQLDSEGQRKTLPVYRIPVIAETDEKAELEKLAGLFGGNLLDQPEPAETEKDEMAELKAVLSNLLK